MASTEGAGAGDKMPRGGGGCGLEGMFQKLCKERWFCAGAGGEWGWREAVGDGRAAGLVVVGSDKTC